MCGGSPPSLPPRPSAKTPYTIPSNSFNYNKQFIRSIQDPPTATHASVWWGLARGVSGRGWMDGGRGIASHSSKVRFETEIIPSMGGGGGGGRSNPIVSRTKERVFGSFAGETCRLRSARPESGTTSLPPPLRPSIETEYRRGRLIS